MILCGNNFFLNCLGDELEANQSMDNSLIYIGTEMVDGAGARPKEELVDERGWYFSLFFFLIILCVLKLTTINAKQNDAK